jgi:hypothetical protein
MTVEDVQFPVCPQRALRRYSAGNSEKLNTEDTESHRGPQRNQPFSYRRPFLTYSSNPSVHSVAFLCVLCVKFRKT